MSHLIPLPVPLLTESVHVCVCVHVVCVAAHACIYMVGKEARREIQEILGSGPVSVCLVCTVHSMC